MKSKNELEKSNLYFLYNPLNNTVKIGETNDYNKRLNAIKNTSGVKDIIILHKENEKAIFESPLHYLFDKFRYQGEWFNYSKEIQLFIDVLKHKIFELDWDLLSLFSIHLENYFLFDLDRIYEYDKFNKKFAEHIITNHHLILKDLIKKISRHRMPKKNLYMILRNGKFKPTRSKYSKRIEYNPFTNEFCFYSNQKFKDIDIDCKEINTYPLDKINLDILISSYSIMYCTDWVTYIREEDVYFWRYNVGSSNNSKEVKDLLVKLNLQFEDLDDKVLSTE